MTAKKFCAAFVALSMTLPACSTMNYVRGGIYRQLDENLTIVSLVENRNQYLNREIVFAVRYYKKGDLPCPLGEDYVNLIIADRVSYIMFNKVWMKKSKASILGTLKENETVVMKARVFAIDKENDPDLEALEIAKE